MRINFLLILIISQIKADCGSLSDERCQGCTEKDKCKYCYESYFDENTKACKVPDTKIDKCRFYIDATNCDMCHLEYTKSENKCKSINIPNCLVADDEGLCRSCNNGVLPSIDKKTCGTNLCNSSNCMACGLLFPPLETCAYCMDGFSLTLNFIVTSCVKDDLNCGLNNNGICELCKEGFFMDKNKCKESSVIPKNSLVKNSSSNFIKFGAFFIFWVLVYFKN